MEQTTSCQIQNIKKNVWFRFRQIALSEGLSASAKVRALIEYAVAGTETESLEKGQNNER